MCVSTCPNSTRGMTRDARLTVGGGWVSECAQAGQGGQYPRLSVLLADKPDKRASILKHMREATLAMMNKVCIVAPIRNQHDVIGPLD
jgi:hypothetical protein